MEGNIKPMVDYYKDTMRANALIDQMRLADKPIEAIYYKINTLFGYTQKFVDKRIKLVTEFSNAALEEKNKEVKNGK